MVSYSILSPFSIFAAIDISTLFDMNLLHDDKVYFVKIDVYIHFVINMSYKMILSCDKLLP